MYIAPPMSHAPSAFAVSAFVLAWLVVRETLVDRAASRRSARLAALMAMVREQDAFFAIGPAIDYVWWRSRSRPKGCRRRSLARAAGRPSRPSLSSTFRRRSHTSRSTDTRALEHRRAEDDVDRAARPAGAGVAGARFFCSGRPSALLGLAGLLCARAGIGARARRPADRRQLASACSLMVAAQVYVAGSVESWTLAGAFGQRRLVALTPLLVVGLAELMRLAATARSAARSQPSRWSWLAVWWNVGLIVQFGAGLMDRQRLELARIAYNNFVTVPRRLPDLAYRYLFDRSSYYDRSEAIRIASGLRILYLADIRFPLERANGIQTMETCYGLASRGHDVTLKVRQDTGSRRAIRSSSTDGRPWRRSRSSGLCVVGTGHESGARAIWRRRSRRGSPTPRGRRPDPRSRRRRDAAAPAGDRRGPLWCSNRTAIPPAVTADLPAMVSGAAAAVSRKLARLERRERLVWRRADGFVTITAVLAGDLTHAFGPRPVDVVPDGVRLRADHEAVHHRALIRRSRCTPDTCIHGRAWTHSSTRSRWCRASPA